jgi:hypothetical protein
MKSLFRMCHLYTTGKLYSAFLEITIASLMTGEFFKDFFKSAKEGEGGVLRKP